MKGAHPFVLRRYGIAVLSVLLAVLFRKAMGPDLIPSGYVTFYAAVLASARYGGVGPGLLASLLSTVLGEYFFLPPLFAETGLNPSTATRMGLFGGTSLLATWLVARERVSRLRVAENGARLRRVIESNMMCIVFWDRSRGLVEANDEFLRLLGYTREEFDAGAVRWADLNPAEYAEADARGLQQILSTGVCPPYEKEILRKDRARVPVIIAGAATTDARDKGVSIILDITERRKVEDELRQAKRDLETRVAERTRALRASNEQLQQELSERQRVATALIESEERYRQISELTSDFAYRLRIEDDGTLVFEWFARAFDRDTGFAVEEIHIAADIQALVHPDDQHLFLDRMVRLLSGEEVVTELRARTRSGEYRWLQDHGRPEWDESAGRVVRILGAARDITERKEAEAETHRSEERFAVAVAGSNDGIWDWNLETNEIYLSPRWKEILGLGDGAVGSHVDDLIARMHPEDREGIVADVRAHAAGRTPHFQREFRMRHADGSYPWVLARGATVRDATGKIYRMAGSMTDITARKQAEEEAQRRQAELAHAQRLSTVGQMAAGLAHELNQPLAAIVSYARGCQRHISNGETNSAQLGQVIDQVARQALRAGEIVQRYRGFVRSAAPRREWVDLNLLAREMVQLTGADAREKGITIRLDPSPAVPLVLVDGLQVQQVLVNLIRNGIEAMQDTGDGELWVTIRLADGNVEVSVRDSGLGIAEDARDHLFDAFFTTKDQGLGIGLSISRSIVETHGGRLWVSPSPGRGATFTFTIPATPAATARAIDTGSRPTPSEHESEPA